MAFLLRRLGQEPLHRWVRVLESALIGDFRLEGKAAAWSNVNAASFRTTLASLTMVYSAHMGRAVGVCHAEDFITRLGLAR